MSLMTHDTKWRLVIGAAPVIGVAFFVWAAAQGEADVARSPTARAILAVVAALGTAVAWWTARQLRAAPTVPVAKAIRMAKSGQLAGLVALRGRARALPDAVPLISPDGELCLWFKHGEQFAHHYSTSDSVRPFLLADDSGECIVLPAGADVMGNGSVPAAAARSRLPGTTDIDSTQDLTASERLLRNGDRIHVVGRFVAASSESLALQAEAASLVARSEASQAIMGGADALPFRDLRAAALAGAAFVAAPPLVRHGLPLPVIAASGASQPFVIRIGSDEEEGGVYGMLAVVDCLVLVVSSSLVAWSMLVPG
jgi:hypothetical protein